MSYRDPAFVNCYCEDIDNKEMFPISPWYGPDDVCPACGLQNVEESYSDRYPYKKLTNEMKVTSPAVFCGPLQRIWIKFWPWPRKCKHPGTHLHQQCYYCKARWVSYPLSDKKDEAAIS